MNVALKLDLQRFVEAQLNAGRFGSAEEAVQAGLELLRDHQQQLERAREQLSEGLEQARRGELLDGEEAFDQIFGPLASERETLPGGMGVPPMRTISHKK